MEQSGQHELRLATFSERAIALSVDYALFVAGFLATQALLFRDPAAAFDRRALLAATWTALFILYQAFFSSEGRASLGKRMMGLRVVTLQHESLGVGAAFIRAVLYLPSSFCGLGFLWSLVSPSRQCWQDLAAGSVVVAERPRGPEGAMWMRAGALACIAALVLSWTWQRVWAPRYHRVRIVAYAYMGLQEMGRLQKSYRERNGRYAENVFELATVSIHPESFLSDMEALFDDQEGIRFESRKDGFSIRARARDLQKTPVFISGL